MSVTNNVEWACDTCGDTEGWPVYAKLLTPYTDTAGNPRICYRKGCEGRYRRVVRDLEVPIEIVQEDIAVIDEETLELSESNDFHHIATDTPTAVKPVNPQLRNPQNVLAALPDDAQERKNVPIGTGFLDYFPLATAEVARISKAGNDQHNPGEPLHWARGKSGDHYDCAIRHLMQRGTLDTDGKRHTAKAAWRIMALLQEELEAEAGWTPEDDHE